MIIKLSLKKIRRLVFIIAFLLIAGFVGYRIGVSRSPNSRPVQGTDLSLFWLVWRRLENKYFNQKALKPKKMIEGAISGMVTSLGDPYTVFLPPADNKINKEDLTGEFGGVGIQLGYKNHTLAVISPLKKTPAEEAGVQAGDLILKIKDEGKGIDQSTEGISLPEAVKLIRGKEETKVILTLAREGVGRPIDASITRRRIAIPALETRWIERNGKRFAYIHLFQFSERMDKEWNEWAKEMVKSEKNGDGLDGLVLDLRNNPGGYLQGAVFVAGEFLPSGKTVVWQETYNGKRSKFIVDRSGRLLDIPLVVLINEGSASAAEILAGALRDHQRAKIIGLKSFGKGTIQEPEELPGKAGLHITIARWLLPNGESINKEGIKPDVEVKEATRAAKIDKDLILEKGIDILINF